MSSAGSVTQLIEPIRAGEEWAIEKLRQRYWPFLVKLARKNLTGVRPSAGDEEDVVQETFIAFFRSLKNGRLPLLKNRQQLMNVLCYITACRAASFVKWEHRVKRGGGRVKGESTLDDKQNASGVSPARPLEQFVDSAITPEEHATLKELYTACLEVLTDKNRQIAELWLLNYSNREVGRKVGCSETTVRRSINESLGKWQKLIERLWKEKP